MENHSVTIENREKLSMTDISEIDSFDEEEIRATLKSGAVIIRGEKLHIRQLDLAEGKAEISGVINSLMYVKVRGKSDGRLISRLIK